MQPEISPPKPDPADKARQEELEEKIANAIVEALYEELQKRAKNSASQVSGGEAK